ncbi:hypothetical protein R83H12_00538 [Fibrobacteria bacterium R8-3-H12]
MSENECENLEDILLDTVKELSRIVKERVKRMKEIELAQGKIFDETLLNTIKELSKIVNLQEQIKVSKFNTCYKYLIIPIIILALIVVIFLCCINGQRNFQCDLNKKPDKILKIKQDLKTGTIPDTIKVQILKED